MPMIVSYLRPLCFALVSLVVKIYSLLDNLLRYPIFYMSDQTHINASLPFFSFILYPFSLFSISSCQMHGRNQIGAQHAGFEWFLFGRDRIVQVFFYN